MAEEEGDVVEVGEDFGEVRMASEEEAVAVEEATSEVEFPSLSRSTKTKPSRSDSSRRRMGGFYVGMDGMEGLKEMDRELDEGKRGGGGRSKEKGENID